MSGFNLRPQGPKISIDDHLSKLDEPVKNLLQEIRTFVLSLGTNVIEEVRPHRIVYSKSFTLRTFLDVEPATSMLVISIKSRLRDPATKLTISSSDQLTNLKELVSRAYASI